MHCDFRSERLFLSASVAVLLLVPSGSSMAEQKPGRTARKSDARCLELRVSSPQADSERRSRRFSATAILDLSIEVRLARGAETSRPVTVKLLTPDGHLYQKLDLTIEPNEASDASGATRPRRRRVDRSTPKEGSVTASAILPVAGTSIVTSSLYGRWTATAHLDGAEVPCARPVPFVITE